MDGAHHIFAAGKPMFGHGGAAEFIILGLAFPRLVAIDQLGDRDAVFAGEFGEQPYFIALAQIGGQLARPAS